MLKTVSETEHYKMVDATLASLLNKVPVVPKQTAASKASAYYRAQKATRPDLTYKQALAEMKAANK